MFIIILLYVYKNIMLCILMLLINGENPYTRFCLLFLDELLCNIQRFYAFVRSFIVSCLGNLFMPRVGFRKFFLII